MQCLDTERRGNRLRKNTCRHNLVTSHIGTLLALYRCSDAFTHAPYLLISSTLKLGWHHESSSVTSRISRWLWPVTKDSANSTLFCKISGTHICRRKSVKDLKCLLHLKYAYTVRRLLMVTQTCLLKMFHPTSSIFSSFCNCSFMLSTAACEKHRHVNFPH